MNESIDRHSLKFSVVVPTLNGGDDLLELLRRVREQRLQPERIVLVDSGSTDGAIEAARTYDVHIVTLSPDRKSVV